MWLLLCYSLSLRVKFFYHYDSGTRKHLQYWHILLISSFEMGHFIFNFLAILYNKLAHTRLHVAIFVYSLHSARQRNDHTFAQFIHTFLSQVFFFLFKFFLNSKWNEFILMLFELLYTQSSNSQSQQYRGDELLSSNR